MILEVSSGKRCIFLIGVLLLTISLALPLLDAITPFTGVFSNYSLLFSITAVAPKQDVYHTLPIGDGIFLYGLIDLEVMAADDLVVVLAVAAA